MAQDVAATRPALQLMQAWNHADAAAWGDLFWPDARFTNVIGGTYVGASISPRSTREFGRASTRARTVYSELSLRVRSARTIC